MHRQSNLFLRIFIVRNLCLAVQNKNTIFGIHFSISSNDCARIHTQASQRFLDFCHSIGSICVCQCDRFAYACVTHCVNDGTRGERQREREGIFFSILTGVHCRHIHIFGLFLAYTDDVQLCSADMSKCVRWFEVAVTNTTGFAYERVCVCVCARVYPQSLCICVIITKRQNENNNTHRIGCAHVNSLLCVRLLLLLLVMPLLMDGWHSIHLQCVEAHKHVHRQTHTHTCNSISRYTVCGCV